MEQKTVNKTETNSYTFIFAIALVVVVGTALAFAATSLQPMQYENQRQEQMQSILATVGVETDRAGAQAKYDEHIVDEVVINADGEVQEGVEAFGIDLAKELKRDPLEQNFPLYVAEVDGETFYVIPLRGAGLWNAIFGYIALEADANTIKGVVFDHLGETPGLGAEITQLWFRERFAGEKIMRDGEIVGVDVAKGQPSTSKDDNRVDAISGATITGDGVADMLEERLQHYKAYFASETTNAANN